MQPGDRICVVTGAHLSACPRMLKAADALSEAGYRVRVVSARTFEWGSEADADILSRRPGRWNWQPVDYRRREAPIRYVVTGLRQRAARKVTGIFGAGTVPAAIAYSAGERAYVEIVRAIAAEPADFIYGGGRALAATAEGARRLRVPYALDLEDFHSDEIDTAPDAKLVHSLYSRIENAVLPGARFLTAGSAAIGDAYRSEYRVAPITVNNTFRLPVRPPSPVSPSDGLRLYWFSQMITPRRGIEDAIHALGIAGIEATLTLRGRPAPGYVEELRRMGSDVAPRCRLVIEKPVPPDELIEASMDHDVGLALEQGYVRNNALALSNKAFTYIAAGLAVVLSSTPGQRDLGVDLGEAAALYAPGDTPALASALVAWANNPERLVLARQAAWEAARRRWNWDHVEEKGRLLRAVQEVT